MQIELTPEQEAIVSRWIAAQRYPGRNAVLVSGLQLLRRLEGARRALNGARADELAQAAKDGFFLIDLTNGPKDQTYEEAEATAHLGPLIELSANQQVFESVDLGLQTALGLLDRREQAMVAFNKSLEDAVAESEANGYHELDKVLAEVDDIIAAAEARQSVPAGE